MKKKKITLAGLSKKIDSLITFVADLVPSVEVSKDIEKIKEHISVLNHNSDTSALAMSDMNKRVGEIETTLRDNSSKLLILIILFIALNSDNLFEMVGRSNQMITYGDLIVLVSIILGVSALATKQIGGLVGKIKSGMGK